MNAGTFIPLGPQKTLVHQTGARTWHVLDLGGIQVVHQGRERQASFTGDVAARYYMETLMFRSRNSRSLRLGLLRS